MRGSIAVLLSALAGLAAAGTAAGQQPLELGALYREARQADPRLGQLELEAAASELRLRNIEAERRPSLAFEGRAQHQSEVVEIPVRSPDGGGPPTPPKDTFDASLRVEQVLLDPTAAARFAGERARLAEARARVETALYTLRREVDEAFFAALLLQEREAQLATTITDLEARLAEATRRVEEGAALPGEAAAIEAALLERRQEGAALAAERGAALARLGEITGRDPTAADRLALPDLERPFAAARAALDETRLRPELARMARTRERLEAQKELIDAGERPRLSAFGQAGFGRPGLDFLADDVNPYWLAGIRVRWEPWSWGTAERERQLLALEQEAVAADEEAFVRSLRRSVEDQLAAINLLARSAAVDERIVALRELVERETLARYEERMVTAADLVDKQTDVLAARQRRATHRVELVAAQARFLTILGLEVE
ncbi:MAG TPA: TolC family protein [Thermoanaerobaculia bacterium]|nr:TolC family protein [Thermoanaerobaculia bacterium]